MPKGIIVLDEIPCSCYKCEMHNYHFCNLTGDCIEEYMNKEERPDNCPIKEQIMKDVGDTVVIPDTYDKSKNMTGVISMITVTKNGIKYRATFDGNSICKGKHQSDFWQDEILA